MSAAAVTAAAIAHDPVIPGPNMRTGINAANATTATITSMTGLPGGLCPARTASVSPRPYLTGARRPQARASLHPSDRRHHDRLDAHHLEFVHDERGHDGGSRPGRADRPGRMRSWPTSTRRHTGPGPG